MVTAKNPIMPGFFPDPSICAVGDDFYLVNSTFSYFPGLPILHSKDLAHWEQIGNALNRTSQLPLPNSGHSQGLFAPTIRYHEGLFYLICTNVSWGGNFIVTATNPEGPWSDPYYLEGADGIDPSLFFDDDGRCYYIGTHPNKDGCRYNGDYFIWIQELDLKTMKLTGEKKDVWNGAMRNICWPEGPHIYKKDDYYYIMHAEGGTGPEHAVTVARSKDIWGPYENCFCNPILTHRHLGQAYPIKYVGHGDLVETKNGEWYMVMLAVRPYADTTSENLGFYTTMGRETFFARVTWENGWPVVNPGVGILTDEVLIDLETWDPAVDTDSYYMRTGKKTELPGANRIYEFAKRETIGDEFMALRLPADTFAHIESGKGLFMKLSDVSMTERKTPSYLCVRQQHHGFVSEAVADCAVLGPEEQAGLIYCQSNDYFLKAVSNQKGAQVVLCENGVEKVLGTCTYTADAADVKIRMDIEGLTAKVTVLTSMEEYAFTDSDIHALSTEVAGGFVGCTIGMYAYSAKASEKEVLFKTFSYCAK